jgi:hypothetical protein
MVQVIEVRRQFCRFLQADLVLARRAGHPFDALQHGVEDRPCEVGFRVRQLRLVVRAGSLAQGKVSLSLQVTDQDRPLPRWSVLQEVAGKDRD